MLIVAKHRNGAVGKVQLAFLAHYAKFANLSRRPQANGQAGGAVASAPSGDAGWGGAGSPLGADSPV